MSVLWITFCQKLTGMGYSSSDLHHCSEAVFLSIVDDMQAFTPLQISALVQEWKGSHTAVKGGSSSNASSIRVIEVRGPDAVGEFSRTDVLNSARKFLRNVSPDGVRLILSVNVNMEVLEVPRHQLQQYQTRRGALFDSSTPLKMCWKLCSPTTIDAILKDYRRSSPHGGFGAELDEDELCSSAIVLYNDDAIEARNVCQEQVSELPHLGWALVGFEVAGGRSRAVTAEELSNLRTFSTMECLEMLDEAGFDSLEVTDRGVMALFHAHQALPRCIVYFDAKLDASHGANGTLENSQRSKSELADASSGRLPPHPRAQVAEAGWSCPSHAKAVEFWSATEKKLLCSHCLYYGGYSRENCVPINEAVQLVSPSLRQWVHHAETFSQEIDGVMKMFDAAQADLDRSAKTTMKDLHMRLERARSRLDECEAALSHQNDQMYQLGTKSLDQSRQKVVEAVKHIDTLVTQVDGIVSAVEAGRPISSTQSIHLLQHAQTVFGPWQSIAIPAYKAPQLNEAIDRLVDQAVSEITMGDTAGKVELPEAIDVNYLKHGC